MVQYLVPGYILVPEESSSDSVIGLYVTYQSPYNFGLPNCIVPVCGMAVKFILLSDSEFEVLYSSI